MNSVINNIGGNPENAVIAHLETGAHGLTKAEGRVFEGVAVGYSRQRIANVFSRQLCTIDRQLEAALSKMGVHSVVEAVALTCTEGKLTFEAVTRGARNLILVGFMLSSISGFRDEVSLIRPVRAGRVS